jgi:hypothetical protein
MNGGKRNRANEIDLPHDVEQTDERSREARAADNRGKCDERQSGGEQVTEGSRLRELRPPLAQSSYCRNVDFAGPK